MDSIPFRCVSCEKSLKVPADKAGRKIKCPSCGAESIVPNPPATEKKPAPATDAADDRGGYSFAVDPNEALQRKEKEGEKPEKEAKLKLKKPKLKRRFRTLQEPGKWAKLNAGLAVVQIAMFCWAGALALNWLVLLLGAMAGPEYSLPAEKVLIIEGQPPPPLGRGESLNIPGFLVALVSGYSLYGVAKTLLILAAIVSLVQYGIAITGYSSCSGAPDHMGIRGQAKTLLILAGVNAFFAFFFKLLPLSGLLNYALVPWFTPELPMIEANIDRSLPVHVFWCKSGFWEMLLSLSVMFTYYAEPVTLGVLLWSTGMFLREKPVEEAGFGVVQVAFGVAFSLLAYYLLSICGTSEVLLIVLRAGYGLWILFSTILLFRFITAINITRNMLGQYIAAAEEERAARGVGLDEEEEEDYDEEEEDEEPVRPRKARKKRRYEEDDEEDD